MARRKKQNLARDLVVLPWQVSAGLACIAFVVLRWVLPGLLPDTLLMSGLRPALAPISWIALCVFGFLALASAGRAKLVARIQARASGTSTSPPAAPAFPTPLTTPAEWSLEALRMLEWKRFELLCARYYEAVGFKTETLGAGPDGGIDVKLYKHDSSTPLAIVQCKAWNTHPVGVKEIRELRGVMVHTQVARGIFVTTATYTQDAIAFAASNPIQLLDGAAFVQKLLDLPAEKRDQLRAFAFKGNYRSPTCASCGVKMVARDGKRGPFWGCTHYPRCKTMLPMRA